MVIEQDKVVLIHYTLTNDAGDVVDSSVGQEPLGYIHGKGFLIPGLEKQLDGKKATDKLKASVTPEEGYGQRTDDLVQEVPKTAFEDQEQLKVGAQFYFEGPSGPQVAQVKEITEDNVVVDMNHPLSGQNLHFDVEVLEIRDATAEELDHGHVHGEGGHKH